MVSAARSLGVMIIHAPSDTMKFYEGTPWRAADAARAHGSVSRADSGSLRARTRRGAQSSPSMTPPAAATIRSRRNGPGPYPWTRENPAIDIIGFDGVSDNGQEIYNFCKQEGITNIALMGVHTNICILNRSFGIRQMTQLGFQVVLVRDLTDSMYDPRTRPFVSHARGTELVIEHIEPSGARRF